MTKPAAKIKFAVCACLIVVLALFTGCDASVRLYERGQDDDAWYFDLCIDIPSELEDTLVKNAAYSESHGRKWTPDYWLRDYFKITSELYGYTYKYDIKRNPDGDGRTYMFYDIVIPKKTIREELGKGLTYSGTTDITTNLFIRTINVVRDNRFDFWIRSLNKAAENGDTGNGGDTLMAMILYGAGHYENIGGVLSYVEDLPGFTDAFKVPLNDYTEIMLTDFWLASSKMNVACDKIIPTDNSKYVYYVFNKRIEDGETKVAYRYFRADPTGWYLVAIACGGVAVGLGFLAAYIVKKRKNKTPKQSVKDSFPYDPFGGNIDPFA